jgi:hypothetical protein
VIVIVGVTVYPLPYEVITNAVITPEAIVGTITVTLPPPPPVILNCVLTST